MLKHLSLLLPLWLTTLLPGLAQTENNPVAHAEAIVREGNLRVTVLTPRMLRLEYSTSAQFEDRATLAVVNRRLPVPAFRTYKADGVLHLLTDSLHLSYNPQQPLDSLTIQFRMNGERHLWTPGLSPDGNLLGTHRTLDGALADNKRQEMERGLLSRDGWALLDESPRHRRGDGSTTFPLEPNADGFLWWSQPRDSLATDWYFLAYGHDYRTCLRDYTSIGGRVPMPPRYILGYWYSRYWAYSQKDFEQIISDVETNHIPMDVLIMDMDWHRKGWTGWSWNYDLIPNPTGLIDYMHRHNLKTALNLHPADGVRNHEDAFEAMRADLHPNDTTVTHIPWALEDYDFYKSFSRRILREHEAEGVDFWWQDWQQHLTVSDNLPLSETFWTNHVFYEDMRINRPHLRPVIYHRWGGMGSHRYPICFSGDAWATWETLAYEIYFTHTASNVCYAYWGHDIGGHMGGNNDPELMQRWMQFGVYTPIFRTHATNDTLLERRVWKYPNLPQLRESIRLRYRLLPYIYTAAYETYLTGVGMCRPLYYDYPEAPEAYSREDEYLYGDAMLIAPITTPADAQGRATRSIWLPDGLWYDTTKRTLIRGNATIEGAYTTDEYPVFYRAGAIIPTAVGYEKAALQPDTIALLAVPGAEGTGMLYEDDGNSQEYMHGQLATTHFSQQHKGARTLLTIGAREGTFAGAKDSRPWKLCLLGQTKAPRTVKVNNRRLPAESLAFDANTSTVTILLPTLPCNKATTIELRP